MTSAILDATGTLTNQQRFLPFGQPRADVPAPFAAPTDFGFTGQRLLDPGMGGLMDYRARFYSPALGRFIQPDTLIPGAGDPQAWNRYAGMLNNPVRYTDPTGHFVIPPWPTIKIADISSWPKWTKIIASFFVGLVGLTIEDKQVRTMNAEEGVFALITGPMGVASPSISATSNSVDDLVRATKQLIEYGVNSSKGKDAIRVLTQAATHNPKSRKVSLGSNGLYQKPGHTYFELPGEVWGMLESSGNPELIEAINTQFMYDQMAARKTFSFTLRDPARPGLGSLMEMKILDHAVKLGQYSKRSSTFYVPALKR